MSFILTISFNKNCYIVSVLAFGERPLTAGNSNIKRVKNTGKNYVTNSIKGSEGSAQLSRY